MFSSSYQHISFSVVKSATLKVQKSVYPSITLSLKLPNILKTIASPYHYLHHHSHLHPHHHTQCHTTSHSTFNNTQTSPTKTIMQPLTPTPTLPSSSFEFTTFKLFSFQFVVDLKVQLLWVFLLYYVLKHVCTDSHFLYHFPNLG